MEEYHMQKYSIYLIIEHFYKGYPDGLVMLVIPIITFLKNQNSASHSKEMQKGQSTDRT
jgi:hypothetical protein